MITNLDFLILKELTEAQKLEIIDFMTNKGGKILLSKVDQKKIPYYIVANFLKRFPELKEYFIN
jgi:hypothetical protein